mmetsp:Transcript_1664/g.5813  ORF Transcript_1664/g.5813 Transcript_1664/m.5813 type:complete len:270 (-) Transcript_1664:489-1298(-)|eukprot:CAMPEP_0117434604 /NCGR_PEP_ID=MMETSP0759-20121206/38_1 /TAXON_ID=63605 /ORGANISM="Percolomonas cosmopolitus, Strain WS" /LENGTH=269 /DNA_ID=CAMNT_0005226099 /DNA_START=689 /DNA_END=1498 /DNA_ORIENTATION=+
MTQYNQLHHQMEEYNDYPQSDYDTDENSSQHSNDSLRRSSVQSKRRRKISRNFTAKEFMELMHLSQRDAAKKLNVCLSTFKRQFSSVRPKLQWPSPSQRKILIHRRRFQNIIEQNQEEIFPSSQFKFGQNNDRVFQEILPDPKVLSEECAQLKKMVESLQKENSSLKEQLFRRSVSPPASPEPVELDLRECGQAVTMTTQQEGGVSDFYASALESSFFDCRPKVAASEVQQTYIEPLTQQPPPQRHHQRRTRLSLSEGLMESSLQLFAF